MKKMKTGTTQPLITKTSVLNLEIFLPIIAEQKKIVALLKKAEQAIEKRKFADALVDQYLQSVFNKMFGDPVTNPKGWEVRVINSYFPFITSGSRGWSKYINNRGTRFIRTQDIQNANIVDESPAYVMPPHSVESSRAKVRCGDLLITITGAYTGKVAVVSDNMVDSFVSQHVGLVRIENKDINKLLNFRR
jgi:type I restriction enzyme S subunit